VDQIAIISDVHGNVPALEATLRDVRRRGIERVFYLRSLPNVVDLTISGRRVRLFHASQRSVHFRIRQNDPPDTLLTMFENTIFTGEGPSPDVVGYGDIHEAFVRNFPLKTLFNVGSVGNPLDIPQASYAVLEGWLGAHEATPFGIALVRVPYDIERAIQDAVEAGMPSAEPYARELRTAQYRGPGEFATERESLQKARGA
jgi:protein phosphatase